MKSTERFSNRVDAYDKGRPRYPAALVDALAADLPAGAVIADIGSGTGLLSQPFVERGLQVRAVEPNEPMRRAAEASLGRHPGFVSLGGTAEASGLESASVDLIIVGQAFHWFNRAAARREFARILKPSAPVALVWNDRLSESSPFMVDYEALLRRFGTDYAQVEHRNLRPAQLSRFFGEQGCRLRVFDNAQWLDWDALQARLDSSSYVPEASHPDHAPMLAHLRQLFDRHQQEGRVRFDYDTLLYLAPLSRETP
ncbi:class I SAM-dependent methyltransferase [Pseudomonas mangiferae]|uniref:Class I SAM-dependent methyltransferase n=1 Tax=Pseudomonas mangiferae TaxID=2593654 RepID=A0A553H3X3_9PSED|nr:class I SAM-dependent methyltransferase [Pseudomonas mangiferae]TRX76451.1 class I SAM-dependent methyltransferase [Pseudomonas mangiferae]